MNEIVLWHVEITFPVLSHDRTISELKSLSRMLRFLILLVLFSGQAYLLEMMCLPLEAAKFEGKHLKVRTYFLLKFSIRVFTGPGTFWNFLGMESPRKRLQVLESRRNLFNSSNNILRFYIMKMFVVCNKIWFWNLIGIERVEGEISWKNQFEFWKRTGKVVEICLQKRVRTLFYCCYNPLLSAWFARQCFLF